MVSLKAENSIYQRYVKGEDFNDGTRSLIIACEDGEEEYSEIEMQKVNAK